jgi:hypothetical protein
VIATRRLLAVLVAGLPGLASCGDDTTTSTAGTTGTTASAPVIDPGDGGNYAPAIDPADFVDVVDNPLLPLAPGSRWVYEGVTDEGTERIEVVVTDEHREVMGVSTVVVRDTATLDGEVIEDTYDWFAQDQDGNVWYFGEDTTAYEGGEPVDTEGSWEAGVDGALPGIVMLAHPAVGDAYRQEYLAGEAEDMGEVVRVGDAETVPFGAFDDLVVTEDWTPLEPDVVEEKYYAAGVGLVLEVGVTGGEERVELVEFTSAG